MGYDVTFHPVSVADLQRLVFDVVDDPRLAKARAAVARDAARRKDLLDGVLRRVADFADEVEAGDAEFGNTLAFASAAVAGYLHPYWYARGAALSFLVGRRLAKAKEVRFVPLPRVAKGRVSRLDDESGGLLGENYTASGVILPEDVAGVEALVERLSQPAGKKPAPIFKAFDEDGLDSLRHALAYAREHGLGLMEATDLVVPISNEAFTDVENMRAHWLNNVDYAKAGPPPKKAKKRAAKPAPRRRRPAPRRRS